MKLRQKTTATPLIAIFLVSILSVIPNASATTAINFDTYLEGTEIENQYQNVGVIFSSRGYTWKTTESQSSPNFLVGYPATYPPTWPWAPYPITFEFVVPGTSTPATTGWVSVTLISVGWATVTATAFDSSDNILQTKTVTNPLGPSNGLNNKDTITFSGVGRISKVDIRITTPYPGGPNYPASHAGDGFGIDDLSFEDIPIPVITIPVTIDIKPGSDPNSINLGSRGVVPVAVLTTDTFDASNVDPETVLFAGASPVRWTMFDVDSDGDLDLLFHFKTQEIVLYLDSVEAILTGFTIDDIPIEGADAVNIVPKGKTKG